MNGHVPYLQGSTLFACVSAGVANVCRSLPARESHSHPHACATLVNRQYLLYSPRLAILLLSRGVGSSDVRLTLHSETHSKLLQLGPPVDTTIRVLPGWKLDIRTVRATLQTSVGRRQSEPSGRRLARHFVTVVGCAGVSVTQPRAAQLYQRQRQRQQRRRQGGQHLPEDNNDTSTRSLQRLTDWSGLQRTVGAGRKQTTVDVDIRTPS